MIHNPYDLFRRIWQTKSTLLHNHEIKKRSLQSPFVRNEQVSVSVSTYLLNNTLLYLFMIRFPINNPIAPVNLFQQNYPHQLMGKRHVRKTKLVISPL